MDPAEPPAAPAPAPAPAPGAPAGPAPRRKPAAALAVGAGILLSRLTGLVRERVFAHYLGNSDAAGAFKAALRIPNLLQNLFGEGVLSASFIPVYARLLAEGKREEAARVASVVASLLALATGVLVLVGTLAARWLIDVIAPGYHGDVRELTVLLVRVMFAGIGLLVLSAWCLGVLNSHRRFFLSYVAPVLWNLAQIVVLIAVGGRALSSRAGQMELVEWVAWATVAGAALQLLSQLPLALRLVGRFRPGVRGGPAAGSVRKVLGNFVPVVISRGVVQLSAYIDQVLASYLGPAAVSGMFYAQTLYLLPISLFGMAISAAELPEMSSALGTDEEVASKLRDRLRGAMGRVSFFVIPSAVAFVALGDVVVSAVFQTGKFGASDTELVWLILGGSSVGMLAATQARLCSSAFFALGDARTPLRFAIVDVSLTASLGYLAAMPLREAMDWPMAYGAAGLAAAAGLAGWVELVLLRRALGRRIGRVPMAGSTQLRALAAALVAGAAAFGLRRVLPLHQPVLVAVVVLGLYGALYLAGTTMLGVPEARGLMRRLRRRR